MEADYISTNVLDFAEATYLSLISVNSRGVIEFVNPAACSLFGYARDELVGQPITIIVPERMRGAHLAGFTRVAKGEQPNLGGRTVEVFALKKNGVEFPIEITLSVWEGRRGHCAGAVIRDISERREREARLLRLASQDTLTGLYNKHQFMALLQDTLIAGRSAAAALIDLDGFKEVNDTHGHAVGDSLLQAVGVRLSYLLSADVPLARLGGDEFAVLFPASEATEVDAEVRAILHAFRKPFTLGPLSLDLSASAGVALAPQHGVDADELLASADFALYRAKAAAAGSFRIFEPSMRSEAQARRALRDELRRALRDNELKMFYQPQVDLRTSRITGFEALIRWAHPVRGLMSPAAFLPALEQSALALDIGWWTLEEAASMAARLNRGGGDYKVSVNLFPAQFRALNLCDKIESALRDHALRSDLLELEVTEQIALADDDRTFETFAAIRDMGVGVAFDDFGTGFASLSSLQRFPLTTLKIDKAFVGGLEHKSSNAAIIRALVAMSSDLGLDTIAEGIETEAQADALLEMGCPSGQGYRYGRPMPAEDVLALAT
ncbi:putative bifunctional diguanylate cyclase/phosphodiesterase [Rhizobium sp. G21]|uniref:putative bifunctional diguanylate cyclase/phosphodiesterase n=1 Tax=Rhizobium sp. G21 TaxID=2758439 RepID=UPI0016025096|nr:EAL domain-containing protein [Rhizobium sp. G21]MBB1248303.1 EAL domain-containing protein [Rhizobium sp. G21]